MTLRRLVAVAAFGIAMCILLVLRSGAADEPKTDGAAAQLTAKYLVVNTKEPDAGCYMANPETRSIQGRTFLVGTVVAPNKRWKSYEGRTVWVALETIISMYEYDSVEQMKELSN